MNMPPTLFDIPVKNSRDERIVFLLDTSGSMHPFLDVVKQHLIEALYKLSQLKPNSTFNVIEFNSVINKWSDKMMRCTPTTVSAATSWLKKLQPTSGTNLLGGLQASFCDLECDSVCVITDSLPDQHPNDVLDFAADAFAGRPVHAIYIFDRVSEKAIIEFLHELAIETYGSFQMVNARHYGPIQRVSPIYNADMGTGRLIRTANGTIIPNMKSCSVTTDLNNVPPSVMQNTFTVPPIPFANRDVLYSMNPLLYSGPYYGWARYRPAKHWLRKTDIDLKNRLDENRYVLAAGGLVIGQTVLARRIEDGFYYLGKVQSQLYEDKFLVEFDAREHEKEFRKSEYEETFIWDMISYDDALRHPVVYGDPVLAPYQYRKGWVRYAPGHVVKGAEKRSAQGTLNEGNTLVVKFEHDGKTQKIGHNLAVWIPQALYDRVSLEMNVSPGARRTFQTHTDYPRANIDGYPKSGQPEDYSEYRELDDGRRRSSSPKLYLKRSNSSGNLLGNSSHNSSFKRRGSESPRLFLKRSNSFDDTTKKGVFITDDGERREAELHDANEDPEYDVYDVEWKNDAPDDAYFSETEFDDTQDANTQTVTDAATNTPSKRKRLRRFGCPKQQCVHQRPPWRYWRNDTAPSLICKQCPNPFLPYRGNDNYIPNWQRRQPMPHWPGPNFEFSVPFNNPITGRSVKADFDPKLIRDYNRRQSTLQRLDNEAEQKANLYQQIDDATRLKRQHVSRRLDWEDSRENYHRIKDESILRGRQNKIAQLRQSFVDRTEASQTADLGKMSTLQVRNNMRARQYQDNLMANQQRDQNRLAFRQGAANQRAFNQAQRVEYIDQARFRHERAKSAVQARREQQTRQGQVREMNRQQLLGEVGDIQRQNIRNSHIASVIG